MWSLVRGRIPILTLEELERTLNPKPKVECSLGEPRITWEDREQYYFRSSEKLTAQEQKILERTSVIGVSKE